MEHAFSPGTLGQPEDYLAIVTGTCKQFFFVRMPRDNCHLVFMPLKTVELAVELTYVPNFDLLIPTPCQEPVSVDRVPSDLVDCRIVSMDLIHALTSGTRIPDFDILVLAASEN